MAGSADYVTQYDRHEFAVMPASLLKEVLAALDQGRRVAHHLPPVPERRDAEPPPQCVVGQREEPLPVDLGDETCPVRTRRVQLVRGEGRDGSSQDRKGRGGETGTVHKINQTA